MTTGFAVGTALILLLLALVWSQPTATNIVGAAVLATGLWLGWVAGWWTKVVVCDHGVHIDNLFFQHVIPWSEFVEFSVDNGLVVRLSDGRMVAAVSFGRSLAGAITQYRGITKKRNSMMAACQKYKSAEKPAADRYQQLVRLHWVAFLVYMSPVIGIAIGIDLSGHML